MDDNKKPKFTISSSCFEHHELDAMFGGQRRYKVGRCFKTETGHFYRQEEKLILHAKSDIINTVHNSAMDEKELEEITIEEFEDIIRKVIFDMGIYKYCV